MQNNEACRTFNNELEIPVCSGKVHNGLVEWRKVLKDYDSFIVRLRKTVAATGYRNEWENCLHW